MKARLALLPLFLLCGCAQPIYWTKPDANPPERDQAMAACRAQVSPQDKQGDPIARCMTAAGYLSQPVLTGHGPGSVFCRFGDGLDAYVASLDYCHEVGGRLPDEDE